MKEPEAVVRMHQAIMDRIAAIPGVTSVGLTSVVPVTGRGRHDPIFAADRNYQQGELPPIRTFKFLSPGLLKTMGNTIVAGRDFTWADVYDMHPVAMVSENLARELWKEPSAALGKQIRDNPSAPWREVDRRDRRRARRRHRQEGAGDRVLADDDGEVLGQRRDGAADAGLHDPQHARRLDRIRQRGQPRGLVDQSEPAARRACARSQEVVGASMARTSFTLVMLAIAGAMALLLGVAGIYGVISYSVSQRTREIGIRMALGAQRAEVTRMFVRYGLGLAAVGIVCGLVAAVALARVMASLLFEVSPMDPLTYARGLREPGGGRDAGQLRARAARDRRQPGHGAEGGVTRRHRGVQLQATFRPAYQAVGL